MFFFNNVDDLISQYYEKGVLAFRYLSKDKNGCDLLLEFIEKEGTFCNEDVFSYLLSEYDKYLSLKDLRKLEEGLVFENQKIKREINRVRNDILSEM